MDPPVTINSHQLRREFQDINCNPTKSLRQPALAGCNLAAIQVVLLLAARTLCLVPL
jgi:hypothetical protein